MIPDVSNPCWKRVLMSETELAGGILATKILLTRLRREVKAKPQDLPGKIAELQAYFQKNSFAAKDIALF
ncbi:MAG TPA: hypothetical protein DD444_08080 [Citreicella sp.]|jgi:hypothetical protein|uniref:Uncharacterized protein n=2 Tax=Salipiger marinus TaxID=555512 RepID=A0A1G8IAU0_9RHOB|nr:hypothetical protein [Salipiger manganoxidans]SDI15947.1 hypothetical protein SAMN04487993_1001332 [Salipiger marinus]HBM59136.1 hypothetical protein [Citreicella sp.]